MNPCKPPLAASLAELDASGRKSETSKVAGLKHEQPMTLFTYDPPAYEQVPVRLKRMAANLRTAGQI